MIAQDIPTGNADQLPEVFDFIEKNHFESDRYVREAATVDLLDDIQNVMLADNTGLHLAHPFLGPKSKKGWERVIMLWDGKPDALHAD